MQPGILFLRKEQVEGIEMCKSRKNAKKSNINTTRRLFVVDIENYCGKPVLNENDVIAAKRSLIKHFHPTENDLIVVGTSHSNNFMNVGMIWQGVRQVLGTGHDGADIALLKAIKDYQLGTFSEVFILSGDGIFAEAVEELALSNVMVAVVSIRRCLSQKLAEIAPQLQFVKQPTLEAA